jgi:putative ABC transport system permease protein
MIRNSIRQLLRTPIKTSLFLLLILIAGMFLTLGISLWVINNRNIEFYQNSFVTIGTVEQRETSIEQGEIWNPFKKEYEIVQYPTYGKIIPLSVLDFEGAQYIHKPEKRPYYASYNPEYKPNEGDSGLSVVEIIPQEDGVPNQPVSVKISRILYGEEFKEGQNIDICDPTLVNPKPIYKGKTYVLCIQEVPIMDEDQRYEYYPHPVILSSQYNTDGIRIQDDLDEDSRYYEVTEDFYNTGIGKRFLEFIKSMEQYKYSIPVTGTNATILLMPFYNKDAYLIQGRDITENEYEKGEKVCLIPNKLAKDNNLSVGESINLRLYYVNYYQSAAGDYFDNSIMAELNAKGEAYSVFEDSNYIIVGIYDTDPGAINGSYGLAQKEVIIPSKSIKDSDANNIVYYGPMKGNTTSFQIPNGTTEEFMNEWGKLGYDQLEINFYDRGYSKLKAGMDNMKNMSLTLTVVGFVMVVFILLFFSHLFIIKQEKRTAIERSLGMGKGKCMVSLLSGISIILILGGVLGSSAGGGISLWLSKKDVGNTYYSTMYSGGVSEQETNKDTRDLGEDIPMVILISALSMSLIILLGEGISIVQMNRNLKREPMELLCRQKE